MTNKSNAAALAAILSAFCASAIVTTTSAETARGHWPAKVTNVHGFDDANGCSPRAGLVVDQKGNFYGTAECGANNNGLIFEQTSKRKYTVLANFSDAQSGSSPVGRLLLAPRGEIYGVTMSGGEGSAGTVYKMTRKGVITVLHAFTGGADGGTPLQGVTLDSEGNIYGTASKGGDSSFDGGDGVIYEITKSGKFQVLHMFSENVDGATPNGELLADGNGNFFGTTQQGGPNGSGVIYKLAPGGVVTIVHALSPSEGYLSSGALTADADGNLYGTAQAGGGNNVGTVYKMAPDGTLTVLHSFGYDPFCFSRNPCGNPNGGVLLKNGVLYGATDHITYDKPIDGTVFRIDADGTFEVIFAFSENDKIGFLPNGPFVMGTDGALYSTTIEGGPPDQVGAIFKVTNYDMP